MSRVDGDNMRQNAETVVMDNHMMMAEDKKGKWKRKGSKKETITGKSHSLPTTA